MSQKFTTKPVNAEAMQVTSHETAQEIVQWVTENGGKAWDNSRLRPGGTTESAGVQVLGIDGQRRNADEGSWVVLINGEFRIFTNDVFEASFCPVPEKARRGSAE